ncbi:MAG: SDR family oxidoreductase [Acidimicrobiales bacterium]
MPKTKGTNPVGILDGKKLLITGVLTDASLAFGVARVAQEQGAEIVLTGAGRGLRLTERTARKLPVTPDVHEFDVTDTAHPDALREALAAKWGRL